MRVLGIDLGSTRIGLALSDPSGTIDNPHSVLRRAGDRAADHAAMRDLVTEYDVDRVVVGLPLSLDGSVGPAAQRALDEVDELRATLGVPVETYDERLTTVSAHQVLREQGVAGPDRKEVVDKVAAAVLLQAWLDGRSADSDRVDTADDR